MGASNGSLDKRFLWDGGNVQQRVNSELFLKFRSSHNGVTNRRRNLAISNGFDLYRTYLWYASRCHNGTDVFARKLLYVMARKRGT